MTIAYSGYGKPAPDSTDLTAQRPDSGTSVTYMLDCSKITVTKLIVSNFDELTMPQQVQLKLEFGIVFTYIVHRLYFHVCLICPLK